VQQVAAENANIIFGAVHDEAMKDAVKVTVIATGIKGEKGSSLAGNRQSVSQAVRSAQQNLKNVMMKKQKLPVEAPKISEAAPLPAPTPVTPEIALDDLEVPAFLRRGKAEPKP